MVSPQDCKPRQFLNLLFGEGSQALNGYVCIAFFPGIGKYSQQTGPTQRAWFIWPFEAEKIRAFILRHKAKDLYISPVVYETPDTAALGNAKAARVIVADADDCHPKRFKLDRTAITETSKGRYQCIWVVRDGPGARDPKVLARYARRIAHTHAPDGCDAGGWTIGHLIRIPGTVNSKPNVGHWTVHTAWMDQDVSLGQLELAYPPMEVDGQALTIPDPPSELLSFNEAMAPISSDMTLVELVHTAGQPRHPTASRSHIMWRLMGELSRADVPIEIALAICKYAKSNKWADEADGGVAKLWRQLHKQYADPDNKPLETAEDVERARKIKEEETQPRLEVNAETGSLSVAMPDRSTPVPLMDPRERQNIPEATFWDRYVEWASFKTDASPKYHWAMALSLTSTVMGDFGKPGLKFGSVPLNLWFIILGGTTRSRKSTARGYGLDILHALEGMSETGSFYEYDLGSDVTAEGLNIELTENPGRAKLFHRDEVHGWLEEIQAKAYMRGIKQTLAELYDGKTLGRLRATGGGSKNTKSVPTAVSLWMMGITERVGELLDADDFSSGFLARFLYVHAPQPEWTADSVRIEAAEVDASGRKAEEDDPVQEALTEELRRTRLHWEGLVSPGVDKPAVIQFTNAALARINQFSSEASVHAQDHVLADILEPTSQRLVINCIKAMCTLAMLRCSNTVEIRDVLKVLSLAEVWYGDLELMARYVQANSWTRRMDTVQKKLAEYSSDTVPWARIYAKCRDKFTPRDFGEIIQSLQDAGFVSVEYNHGERCIRKIGW